MEQTLIELSLGDVVQIGQYQVTLLSVDGDTVCVEVYDGDGEVVDLALLCQEFGF